MTTKTKENIRVDLIAKARELLVNKGLDFLTARKLSDYSGYSVGTIYNQFKSLDLLFIEENILTLDELWSAFKSAELGSDAYKNLNNLLDKFVEYVLDNKTLWFSLYHFHFTKGLGKNDLVYMKKIVKIVKLLENNLRKLFVKVPARERLVSGEVLFATLFALSSLLTTEKEFVHLEKKYVVKVLFNTYLAGMSCLVKK